MLLLALLNQSMENNLLEAKAPASIAKLIRPEVGDAFRFAVASNYSCVLQAEKAPADAKEVLENTASQI